MLSYNECNCMKIFFIIVIIIICKMGFVLIFCLFAIHKNRWEIMAVLIPELSYS